MDAGGAKGKAKSDINVTPLIDIVLVLLIVFIVMVPGLTKAAPLVVPQVITTTNPPNPNQPPPLVVTVTQDGKFMLQSDEIEIEKLSESLVPALKLMPLDARKVFLKVDEDQRFQLAVDAMDQIRIASDQVKKDTAASAAFNGFMGSDTKVAISIRRRG